MPSPIVFFDLAGPDDAALQHFYATLFDWQFQSGQIVVPVTAPLGVAIRRDPAEKRIYIGVPDVTAVLTAVEANGGSIDMPRFEVRGVVVLGLFKDPAGNAMGLVEMDGEKPRIP